MIVLVVSTVHEQREGLAAWVGGRNDIVPVAYDSFH